jgi:hypothetical protein
MIYRRLAFGIFDTWVLHRYKLQVTGYNRLQVAGCRLQVTRNTEADFSL